MQKITICGNLTADPTLNEREWVDKESGEILKASVCNFTVAVDNGYGEHKNTQYFRVNVWRTFGEKCAEILKKGHQVLVHGSIALRNYVDKNNNIRAVMEIRPDEIQFLNGKSMKVDEQPATETDGMPY